MKTIKDLVVNMQTLIFMNVHQKDKKKRGIEVIGLFGIGTVAV